MAKYKFSDRTMFAIVMRDEELCKEFIERLFPNKKVRKLHFPEPEQDMEPGKPDVLANLKSLISVNVETEKSIITGITTKSVRLDVLFEDSDTLYDIEMQVETEKHLPQRSRYYHSVMSVNSMKKGRDYGELKKSYVIFICMYDPFEKGEALYEFEMTDRKLDLQLNDGTYTIIANIKCPKGKVPKELVSFYNYVDTGEVDAKDLLVSMISERVAEVNNYEEVSSVMTIEEELVIQYNLGEEAGLERGRDEGAANEKRENAKKMIAEGISVEIVSRITGLSPTEIEAL